MASLQNDGPRSGDIFPRDPRHGHLGSGLLLIGAGPGTKGDVRARTGSDVWAAGTSTSSSDTPQILTLHLLPELASRGLFFVSSGAMSVFLISKSKALTS